MRNLEPSLVAKRRLGAFTYQMVLPPNGGNYEISSEDPDLPPKVQTYEISEEDPNRPLGGGTLTLLEPATGESLPLLEPATGEGLPLLEPATGGSRLDPVVSAFRRKITHSETLDEMKSLGLPVEPHWRRCEGVDALVEFCR